MNPKRTLKRYYAMRLRLKHERFLLSRCDLKSKVVGHTLNLLSLFQSQKELFLCMIIYYLLVNAIF